MATFAKGSKPGFGGAAFAGYNRELDNNLVIGDPGQRNRLRALPFREGPARGFNFAETSVKVGYDMGRFMPYVTVGVAFAKPNAFGVARLYRRGGFDEFAVQFGRRPARLRNGGRRASTMRSTTI